MIKEHSQFFVALMGVADLLVTAAAWILCYFVRFHSGWFTVKDAVAPGLEAVGDVLAITLLLSLLIFSKAGLYQSRRLQPLGAEVLDVLRACAVIWLGAIVISNFLHSAPVSRKLMGLFMVVWPVMMVAYRSSARVMLRGFRSRGRNTRSVCIVGAGRLGQTVFHTFRRQPWMGFEVKYFVDNDRAGSTLLGVPVLGPADEIGSILPGRPVDSVFVALPRESAGQMAQVLDQLSTEVVDVNVVPDLLSYHFLRHQIHQVGSLAVVNLTHSPQSGWKLAAKRLMDIVVSAAALLTLAIPMLAIAAIIRLSTGGAVFYRQRRASLGGKEFDILKFCSMRPGADVSAQWGTDEADPRITPVGRVLRRLSLDELPQLINVLRGDMSLVGPRPEQPGFIKRFSGQVPRYMLRHHVKAGITGWAQVKGFRGRTSIRKRIQYDLDYINRWSLGFDLWIIVLTVFRGFLNRA